MTKHLDKFTSFEDATMYIERYIAECRANDRRIVECRVIYVDDGRGGFWSAGISYAG